MPRGMPRGMLRGMLRETPLEMPRGMLLVDLLMSGIIHMILLIRGSLRVIIIFVQENISMKSLMMAQNLQKYMWDDIFQPNAGSIEMQRSQTGQMNNRPLHKAVLYLSLIER
jgi:hypothetical protein